MIQYAKHGLLILALYGKIVMAAGPVALEPGRGELLYATSCLGCHTEQVYWRDKKLAKDWGSLVSEVKRWQAVERLGWSADDIELVARYLNIIHYHYPAPEI